MPRQFSFSGARRRGGGGVASGAKQHDSQSEECHHQQEAWQHLNQVGTSRSQGSDHSQAADDVHGAAVYNCRGDGACESTICWHPHGEDRVKSSICPLEARLSAPTPGLVLVVVQSLSFSLGVVLALCDADVDFESGSSAVTVLCPPAWWDLTLDDAAERELAQRFSSVLLRKTVPDCQGLLECGAANADLVCVVSSRVSDKKERSSHSFHPVESAGEASGSGDHSGSGQGSDEWAMGVVVDVLGLVPTSTRVVVRFDDAESAEQHQVISAHVRRRAAVRQQEQRDWREEEVANEGDKEDQEGDKEEENAEQERRPAFAPAYCGPSPRETTMQPGGCEKGRVGVLEQGAPGESRGREERDVVYFDDTRGVVREGFEEFFATMSGYASGDVVIGNAAELLLLQVCTRMLKRNSVPCIGCM